MPFHYFLFGLTTIGASYIPMRLFYRVPALLIYRLSLFLSMIMGIALFLSI